MTLKKLILLLATAGCLASCIKEPVDEADIPATSEEVQSALSEAWGQADPLSMTPNDFLFQETEQKLESNPEPFFVLQEGITISKKEETATDYVYTFLYQNKVYKQGEEGSQSTREDHRSVSKGTPAASVAAKALAFTPPIKTFADDYQMTLGFERLYSLAYACVKTDSIDKYCKENLGVDSCDIKCSNLKAEEETVPVPDQMKARPGCGGFADCTYRVKRVKFDWTISLKKGDSVETQRVNYAVALSPDMPFFSRLTEYCFRQLFPVQTQKVLVTTCTKLKDYKKGTP